MLYDPMKDYDEVGQVFIKAADYIDEHGHTKGTYGDNEGGSVCAIGAISMIIFGRIELDNFVSGNSIYYKCKEALWGKTGKCKIVHWNDSEERTKDDVTSMFRSIAEDHKLVKA